MVKLLPAKSKEIVSVRTIVTEFGEGHEADVRIGNEVKKCTRIKDRETGEIHYLGDPRACEILVRNLEGVGISVEERLKNQGE